MSPHLLPNFEMEDFNEDEPKFKGVFFTNSLPKTKDGRDVINLDKYKSKGTHWIALYVNGYNVIYFDSFGVEHIPKEIKKFIGNKDVTTKIFRIQAHDSIMCGHLCIGFVDFML